MTELELNDFLLKGRIASDAYREKGATEIAVRILQVTSLMALQHLPPSRKVTCGTCFRQLHVGQEIEFYNHVGMCMGCDTVYSDCLADQDTAEFLDE